MQKIRVGLILGGQSTEHEVSLQSAKNILDALDRNRYDVALIGIDKEGAWHVNHPSNFLLNADDPAKIALRGSDSNLAVVPGQTDKQVFVASATDPMAQIDVAFPIVHGTLGEDGCLQGLLKMANLPFVGSGVLGSAICMDKDVAKRLLRDAGLQVAPFVTVTRHRAANVNFASMVAQLGLPLFVKPANQGSSVGVSKVRDEQEFHAALVNALKYDHKVLVEKAIAGREIECAVLGNAEPAVSGCGEVVVNDDFYAYDTKYLNEDGATVVVPADISYESSELIRATALRAFATLECSGLARVDVFLTESGEVFINELNTLPGFTNISMYPKLWAAAGLSYSDLITRLIELALEKGAEDAALSRRVQC